MALSRRKFVRNLGLFGLGALAGCATPRVSYTPVRRESQRPNFPRRTGRGRALIVNGDSVDFVHMENLVRTQKFLLGIGYGVDEITILSAPYEAFVRKKVEGLQRIAGFEGFPIPEIRGPATSRNVGTSLDEILGSLSLEQELFVYVTGHGLAKNGSSYAVLNKRSDAESYDKLTDQHLKEVLEKGKFGNAVVLFDGCKGEGFSRNIGGGRITAIAKNKFEHESGCAYFAEYFFNTPWSKRMGLDGGRSLDSDLDRDGVLYLQEAAQYADKTIREGGVESDLIITGDYNPALIPVKEAEGFSSSTFTIFLPNSPIQKAHIPLLNNITAMDNVVKIESEEQVREALSNSNARFYFHLDGCPPCRVVMPFIKEILDDSDTNSRPTLYILSSGKDLETEKVKKTPEMEAVAKHFGLEYVWPQFVKVESGRMVKHERGLPLGPINYGTLPDKTIEVVDKNTLRECLL